LTLPECTTLVHHFSTAFDRPLGSAVAAVFKRRAKGHPVFRDRLDAHGNVLAKLVDSVLDKLPEAVQVALRKLADSKQSAITWNALHQMADAHRGALWDAVRKYLVENCPEGKTPRRRALARGLSEVVQETLDKQPPDIKSSSSRARRRTPEETFALQASDGGRLRPD